MKIPTPQCTLDQQHIRTSYVFMRTLQINLLLTNRLHPFVVQELHCCRPFLWVFFKTP